MVDFTQPYIESGLVVVASVKKTDSNAWAFFKPFTPMMWAVTAIFFLLVGAVVWILEHRLNDDFRGTPKQQMVTILWYGNLDFLSPFLKLTILNLLYMLLMNNLSTLLFYSASTYGFGYVCNFYPCVYLTGLVFQPCSSLTVSANFLSSVIYIGPNPEYKW